MNQLILRKTSGTPVEKYADFALEILHTGSRVICDPSPTDTDDDYLFLCDPATVKSLEKLLLSDGFSVRSEDSAPHSNKSVNLEEYPIIESDQDKAKCFKSFKTRSVKDLDGSELLNINIILTCSEDYFENFLKATRLSRYLNLLDKEDRIAVFNSILYDEWPSSMGRRKNSLYSQGAQILSSWVLNGEPSPHIDLSNLLTEFGQQSL